MTHARLWLTSLFLALAASGFARGAHAKEEFPGQVQQDLSLQYQVPCSVCHIKGNTGASTPITPLGLSLRARGLSGDNASLSHALTRLETDRTDSDGDGTSDVDELRAGTDPNSSANANIIADQEPGYGCGGTAPHGRTAGALGGVVCLGWFLLRRRRGHS